MRYAGVDGCHKGWFLVSLDQNNNFHSLIFKHIDQLWDECKEFDLILIDIPIGLPYGTSRKCDIEARKLLGGRRGSSVFPAPTRAAVNQPNYEDACVENLKITGKKLSKQAWNISPKIREVDELMLRDQSARGTIRESHPEVGFWSLAGSKPMIHNKKKKAGIQERLAVLKKIDPMVEHVYAEAVENTMRKDVARDDIVDAIALALIAAAPRETLCTVPEHPEKDLEKLPMEIVYTNRYF